MKRLIFAFILYPFALFAQVPSIGNDMPVVESAAGTWSNFLSGLIADFPCDAINSGTVPESTGTYPGTNAGATVATGKISNAYSFVAANEDYISTSFTSSSYADFTVSVWVNISLYNYGDIFGHNFRFTIITYADGHIYTSVGNGSSWGNAAISSAGQLSSGTWYNILVIRESGIIRLYKNNSLIATSSTNNNNLYLSSIYIGARYHVFYNGPIYHLDGKVDQLSIWSRAITSTERTDLYENELAYVDFTAYLELKMHQLWQQFYYPTKEINTPLRIAS